MQLKNKEIPIHEIFASIQGEGPRICPAIFIRSALCCFTCEGFGCESQAPDGTIIKGCDTIRAVSPKFKEKWKYYSNYKDLLNSIKPLLEKSDLIDERSKRDIVWTGGEPLLYWNTELMQNILAYFISRNHHFTIETNASLDIDFFREYQKEIMFSMSVKLSNSGEPKSKRINIETITKIAENTKNSYLKFVINPNTFDVDIKEIYEILHQIPYYMNVYLMPLGRNQQELHENTKFVMDKCNELEFRFSDRLHIRAYNDLEGV